MAATVKASKAYDLSGGALKEDLTDIIFDISPMDTWFLSNLSRGTAKSTTHEWLSDSLGSAATNAMIEGDAFSAQTRTLPSRLKNYTQISRRDFEVTGTAEKVDSAGFASLMAYHSARAMKEIKRDIEVSMLTNNPASAGTSVSPRVSGGVPNWIYSLNHIKMATQTTATTTAPASGFATADYSVGSTTAMTSTDLNNALAKAWSCGGETDTILCPSSIYNLISGFTSIATRFRDVGSRQQAQIIGAADVYVSAYGSHNVRLSRWMATGSMYALDMKTWGIDFLRPFAVQDIAKIGDAERRYVIAEWTLVAKSPRANTKVQGIT